MSSPDEPFDNVELTRTNRYVLCIIQTLCQNVSTWNRKYQLNIPFGTWWLLFITDYMDFCRPNAGLLSRVLPRAFWRICPMAVVPMCLHTSTGRRYSAMVPEW